VRSAGVQDRNARRIEEFSQIEARTIKAVGSVGAGLFLTCALEQCVSDEEVRAVAVLVASADEFRDVQP